MPDAVRWGILGAAKIARKELAPAIHAAKGGALTALASTSADKAAAFVDRYPGLKVHDSYETMLADPDVDAVYIPLPNHLHVPWTERALEAGKHVLCEKPLGLNVEEVDRLIALRDRTGLVVGEAAMVLHHPQWLRVREMVRNGDIGRLRHVDGVFTYNNAGDPGNVRQKPEMGGGALRDIGFYPCTVTRFVTGEEPRECRAEITEEGGVDTLTRGFVEFDGFALDFYCAMRLGLRQEMVFHGEDGWIQVTAPFNADTYDAPEVRLVRPDRSEVVERFQEHDQYMLQIEAFNAAIHGGAAFTPSLEFSRRNQALLDALFDAAG